MQKLLLILCSIILFSSCSKDDGSLPEKEPPIESEKMVKELRIYVDSFNSQTKERKSYYVKNEIKQYSTTYEKGLIYTHSSDSLNIWIKRQKETEDILAGKTPPTDSSIPSNIKDFDKYLIECKSKVGLYESRIKEYRSKHTDPMYSAFCTWDYKVVPGKEYQFEYLSCGGTVVFDKNYTLLLVLNLKEINHPLGFYPEWY